MESAATLRLRRPGTDPASIRRSPDYEVYHCEYAFDKGITKSGEIRTNIIAGNIKVVIPAFPTDELLNWAFDCWKRYSGEIAFNKLHEEVAEKISFEDGRCVSFRIHYESGSNNRNVVLMLTIHAKQMIINNHVEYKQK